MVHGVIGMCGIIQILIEIPTFGAEVFIEGPADTRKRAVLIEAGLAARRCRICSYEELVPCDQALTRFKFQRVHESNHLPWTNPDLIAIARYKIGFDHRPEAESSDTARQDIAKRRPHILPGFRGLPLWLP